MSHFNLVIGGNGHFENKEGKIIKKTKIIITFGVFLATVYFLIKGNETFFPSATVAFMLLLISFRKNTGNSFFQYRDGKAARHAITAFSIFFMIMNLITSLFLPSIASYYKIEGLYDGDFVRVTINDMHEFCYSICFLLLLDILFFSFSRKKYNPMEKEE